MRMLDRRLVPAATSAKNVETFAHAGVSWLPGEGGCNGAPGTECFDCEDQVHRVAGCFARGGMVPGIKDEQRLPGGGQRQRVLDLVPGNRR
jgi:hypothetical protein